MHKHDEKEDEKDDWEWAARQTEIRSFIDESDSGVLVKDIPKAWPRYSRHFGPDPKEHLSLVAIL